MPAALLCAQFTDQELALRKQARTGARRALSDPAATTRLLAAAGGPLFHEDRLSQPMRWLLDRRDTDAYRVECTGFGINMVSGNYEFPCLILIDDDEWWERYGGRVEANWEMERIRRYSSRDAAGIQALILDPRWATKAFSPFSKVYDASAHSVACRGSPSQRSRYRLMADNWYVGNAVADGQGDHRGWLIGNFLDGSAGVRSSDAVEVKWGIHPAGDNREAWQTGEQRTTALLLVKGRFRIELSTGSFVLEREGDYAVWRPSLPQ